MEPPAFLESVARSARSDCRHSVSQSDGRGSQQKSGRRICAVPGCLCDFATKGIAEGRAHSPVICAVHRVDRALQLTARNRRDSVGSPCAGNYWGREDGDKGSEVVCLRPAWPKRRRALMAGSSDIQSVKERGTNGD